MSGFIFIIHEREFINTNEQIYRISGYAKDQLSVIPRHSIVIGQFWCSNYEAALINIHYSKIEVNKKIGIPYFNGDAAEIYLIAKAKVDEINAENLRCIKLYFHNFMKDVSFGGTKRLILPNGGKIFYLEDKTLQKVRASNYIYSKMLELNLISNHTEYDLNSYEFNKSIYDFKTTSLNAFETFKSLYPDAVDYEKQYVEYCKQTTNTKFLIQQIFSSEYLA